MLCKSQAALSTCRRPLNKIVPSPSVFIYRSVRANSSVAAGEGSNGGDGDKPQPKKRFVPKADSFGDIFIPSGRNGAGGGTFKPNLWALGPSEATFAGKLARRQIQKNPDEHPPIQARGPRQPGDRPYVKRWSQQTEGQPEGERGQNRRASGARDDGGRERRPRREGGSQATERTERSDISKVRSSMREARAEYSAKNLRIETTDLESLFGAPSTTPSTQVVPQVSTTPHPRTPSRSSKAKPGALLSSHVKKVLERDAGDYKRYLFGAPRVIRGDSLSTVGPLGYARLTVMRRQDVGLNQRKNGLKIVSTLTKGVNASSQLPAPST